MEVHAIPLEAFVSSALRVGFALLFTGGITELNGQSGNGACENVSCLACFICLILHSTQGRRLMRPDSVYFFPFRSTSFSFLFSFTLVIHETRSARQILDRRRGIPFSVRYDTSLVS